MIPSHIPLGLVAMVRLFAVCRDHVTVAQFRAAHCVPASAADIAAAFRAAGLVPGYAALRPAGALNYENWLHLAVRQWCAGRPTVTLDALAAGNPELPSCGAARREIVFALGRLGYARAYVRPA